MVPAMSISENVPAGLKLTGTPVSRSHRDELLESRLANLADNRSAPSTTRRVAGPVTGGLHVIHAPVQALLEGAEPWQRTRNHGSEETARWC